MKKITGLDYSENFVGLKNLLKKLKKITSLMR